MYPGSQSDSSWHLTLGMVVLDDCSLHTNTAFACMIKEHTHTCTLMTDDCCT